MKVTNRLISCTIATVTSAVTIVTNDETGIKYKAAGAAGDFVATNLPPGTYTVTTELNGFRPGIIKGVGVRSAGAFRKPKVR